MKVKDVDNLTVSQTVLAKALNLSRARIFQLIQEEVVIKDEGDPESGVYLVRSIINYYETKKNEGGLNYWTEKAKHEKVKRELAEIKLKEAEKEMFSREEVELGWYELVRDIKNLVDGTEAEREVNKRIEEMKNEKYEGDSAGHSA